jgi:hypothetical protein
MLKGKQKKLDVNKDGKISGDDFAMLKNVRMQKKDAMGKKVVKAESGVMITEAEAPDLGGMMGAELVGDIEGSVKPFLKNKRPLPMLRDSAIERIASRSRPLPMLEEPQQFKKEKSITPKERRERDIAKRAQKKMGGGMMMQDSMGYKKGGAVRGGRKEIKGLRPAKMF